MALAMAMMGGITAAAVAQPLGALGAPPPPAPSLSPEDKAMVQRAVSYIDQLNSAEGRFSQTDPRGRVSTGLFYIQRPGKARFQYDPPAQLLVVADGVNVSVYDRQLKSFDQTPLAQTPLAWLLAKPFRLDHGAVALGVERRKDGFAIPFGDARRRGSGRLTLQFVQAPARHARTPAPIVLAGWTLVDPQGQTTQVRLTGLKPRAGLDPKLFVLKDSRGRAAPANVAY